MITIRNQRELKYNLEIWKSDLLMFIHNWNILMFHQKASVETIKLKHFVYIINKFNSIQFFISNILTIKHTHTMIVSVIAW